MCGLCKVQVQSLARLSWLLTAGTAAQQLAIVLVRRRGLHHVTTVSQDAAYMAETPWARFALSEHHQDRRLEESALHSCSYHLRSGNCLPVSDRELLCHNDCRNDSTRYRQLS